ncbi:plant invertase/pectin methylesterase inhibitor superfamily [Actinidia rufa]|uniref:Pectinesterase n=1 Tax=Actinidia rufa TaxID=165716 RepID=A0A7J0E4L8_9ERIC|nr:plant invertase/pectin methylesterase inhibitor superfamily [Actinidia rufa]
MFDIRYAKMLALSLLSVYCWSSQAMPFDIVVAQDGSGNFSRISDAIMASPNLSARRYYIRIREGLYTENVLVGKEKTNIVLVGDGMDKTVISSNKSNGGGFQTYDSATVGLDGQGFVAQDITFTNTAGPNNHQAVALRNSAGYSAFFRCRFQGYQDTLYTFGGYQFFRDSEIYGTVDFIFGKAPVVLQNCRIYVHRPLALQSNTITAQKKEKVEDVSGIVIQNCTITAAPELRQQSFKFKTFLGRPWGNLSTTIIMQSYLDDIIDPKGWLEWEGRDPNRVYYAEYQNRGPGSRTRDRVQWARVINSSVEAAKFTVRNFIQGGKWIPSTGIPFFLDLL